jgi:hypothetical protein
MSRKTTPGWGQSGTLRMVRRMYSALSVCMEDGPEELKQGEL